MQETWVRFLDREDPLEEGMVTHSILLPEGFHRQRSLVGCSPWGLQSWTRLSDFDFMLA